MSKVAQFKQFIQSSAAIDIVVHRENVDSGDVGSHNAIEIIIAGNQIHLPKFKHIFELTESGIVDVKEKEAKAKFRDENNKSVTLVVYKR